MLAYECTVVVLEPMMYSRINLKAICPLFCLQNKVQLPIKTRVNLGSRHVFTGASEHGKSRDMGNLLDRCFEIHSWSVEFAIWSMNYGISNLPKFG